MAGKQEEQSQLCHPLHSPCPLVREEPVVGATGWGYQVEGAGISHAMVIHVDLLRCALGRRGRKGRSTGSHPAGVGVGETPSTFRAVETIWGRSGLGVHSSWKALVLHIWRRTLQSENLE